MDLLKKISTALRNGEDDKVNEFTRQAIDAHISPKRILDEGLIKGMNVVGDLFRRHEIFLPEVLLAAKAMYAGMDQLKPILINEGVPSLGKVVIGTVHGDLHDIGKNLVGIMLKGAGFEVIDLGKGVTPEKFITAAQEQGAAVIGMSALLTTTMPAMKEVTEQLRRRNLTGQIKTIIGGAPVTEEYARKIGADAFAYDAAKAVEVVRNLIQES